MVYAFGNWEEEIAEVAVQFMNATIQIYDPKQGTTTAYNPTSDTGGTTTPTALWSGKARVQHIRVPMNQATEYQWDMGRNYRFQVPWDATIEGLDIRPGLRVKVTACDRDPQLMGLVYTVQFATNSSHRAVRTIETIAGGM